MEAQNHTDEQAEQVDRDWVPGAEWPTESAAQEPCPVSGEGWPPEVVSPAPQYKTLGMKEMPSTEQSWDEPRTFLVVISDLPVKCSYVLAAGR